MEPGIITKRFGLTKGLLRRNKIKSRQRQDKKFVNVFLLENDLTPDLTTSISFCMNVQIIQSIQ
jgi:hypothetical protein